MTAKSRRNYSNLRSPCSVYTVSVSEALRWYYAPYGGNYLPVNGIGRLSRNVGNCHHTLSNNPYDYGILPKHSLLPFSFNLSTITLQSLLGYPVYRVSQEECARLRESVPYVKVYRYNPKHLHPKLNGYGDNDQRKVRSSRGSTYCTCSADALRVQCACPSFVYRQLSHAAT
jgi:hypothetical protein